MANIARQQFNLEEVDRVVRNFTKDSKTRYSREYFRLREESLREKWNACELLHFEVKVGLKESDKLDVYLQGYERIESMTLEHLEIFRSYIRKDEEHDNQAAVAQQSTSIRVTDVDEFSVPLERIKIPKFDGAYTNWASFSDIFKHMIHENRKLGGVQKMHYLRTSVTGEAAQIIKHLSITESNYDSAWELLCGRYDNKRVTVNAFVKLLWELKPLGSHNGNGLKLILNTANEVLNSFKNLGVQTTDILLIHLLQQKLDPETSLEWHKYIGGSIDIPTIDQFLEFLRQQTIILEATRVSEKRNKFGVNVTHVTNEQLVCKICEESHKIQQCPNFLKSKESDRKELTRKLKLCFNCLSSKHHSTACLSSYRCRFCKGKHNTLLHAEQNANKQTAPTSISPTLKAITNVKDTHNVVLLATAIIWIRNASGLLIPLRALLDQGSQRSFVTEVAAQRIGMKRQYANVSISGIGNQQSSTRGSINAECKHRYSNEPLHLNLLILSKITEELPQKNVSRIFIKNWKELADPNFYKSGRIDILIGSDYNADLILPGLRKLSQGKLIMQNTKLGWIISGRTESSSMINSHVTLISLQEINDNLKRFWEMEEVEASSHLTPEQESCESHYAQTTRRDPQCGRYTVRLPFKYDVNLGEALAPSMKSAISRWLQSERRLEPTPELKAQYHSFMEEYLKLDHMEEVPADEIYTRASYYLPHHSVIKESSTTTKLRVVFDASYRTTSGQSLNDVLMVGPKIQNDLTAVLLKWRLHKIVIAGDIEKMYRQVLVDIRDRNYLRIVWRPEATGPIKHFRLKTVTYGTACAAYQAIKTLNKLALDERFNYEHASAIVLNDFYVDDLLTGASNIKGAMDLQKSITQLLTTGGFSIRKWASNSTELLASIPEEERATPGPIQFDCDHTIKTLGLEWNPQT